MTHNLLVYGAAGFSGRLIAAEGKAAGMSRNGGSDFRMILAGRDPGALAPVATENDMDVRVFPLADVPTIQQGLAGIDVVINAAGPFYFTAPSIVEAAVKAQCDYVDLNGEFDVYRELRKLYINDFTLPNVIVFGAGATGGASDLLVDRALAAIPATALVDEQLGAIRVAHTKEFDVSRGSAATALRELTEDIAVVGTTPPHPDGDPCCAPPPSAEGMAIYCVPVGSLERAFDFGPLAGGAGGRRVASGLSLVDTLAALDSTLKRHLIVQKIESYEAMDQMTRLVYQAVAAAPLVFHLPIVAALANKAVRSLPDGPTPKRMDEERHAIVVEIDDIFGARLVEWRLETPNVYRLTAALALGAAIGARRLRDQGSPGWKTVAEALGPAADFGSGPLAGCVLDRRKG